MTDAAILGGFGRHSGILTRAPPEQKDLLPQLDPARQSAVHGAMTRTARLEARITPDLHALLKRAAELEGRSLSDFVVAAARSAAESRLERDAVIRLSLEDQRAFVEAILDPPAPTPALRRAFRRHRELIDPSR
jgi:uncharacterized protein (DUF1778 family)